MRTPLYTPKNYDFTALDVNFTFWTRVLTSDIYGVHMYS